MELSKENNIRLAVVHNKILNLAGILEIMPTDIPRRIIDAQGPIVLTL